LKNAIVESTILKSGYDYDDCCCGESCSCGKGHNRIELNDKMTILESESTILKNGYDYDDCCCGDECSCGKGHNRIELDDKMTMFESESTVLKNGYDYDDCCCGDECSCGEGHRDMDGINVPEITDVISNDTTIAYDINNIVIDNLLLGQSDINIPLIALKLGFVLLIGLFIEVCDA
jgi:hypothetical protein